MIFWEGGRHGRSTGERVPARSTGGTTVARFAKDRLAVGEGRKASLRSDPWRPPPVLAGARRFLCLLIRPDSPGSPLPWSGGPREFADRGLRRGGKRRPVPV